MAKFRIRCHGGVYGQWWSIQEKKFGFLWVSLASYISNENRALEMIGAMEAKDRSTLNKDK